MQNTAIAAEKMGKHKQQPLLWELWANRLGDGALAMSAMRISFFLRSVPFFLQSEISHLRPNFPEEKTTVILSYTWLVYKMETLLFFFFKKKTCKY